MEGGNPQQSPQQGAPPNRQQNPYARYPQGQQGQQMGHPQYGGMAPHGQQAPPHSGRPGPQAGAPYGTSPGTAYPAGYVPGTSFQPQMAYAGQQGYYYPPQQMAGYVYMPPPGAYPQAATTGQAARPPPKRERKAIAIIDPTTNEEVKIEGVDKKERKVSVSEDAEKKGDESKKKEEDEKKKKEEEEKKKKDEEEKKKKEEEERKKKEEEEERLRKEKEEEERKKKEEEERLRAEEKKKEEEERLRQEEEERKKKEEEEARLKQEEEDRKKEEEERLKAEEQEKKKEEEERAKQEEEEKKKKEEEERKKKEEEEKARKEKEAEENKKKDEELRKQLEELEDGEIVDSADEPPRKKRAINVVYPADCWSPTHTSGKKWYPIDLLLQFKDVCLTAPADAVLPQDLLPGGRPPSTSSRGGAGGSRGGRPNPRAPSQDGRGGDYRGGPLISFGPQGQMVYQQPPGGRGPVQRQQSGGMRGGGRQGGRGGREGSRDGRRQQQQGSQPILPDESIEPIPVSGENAWKPRAAVDVNALDEEKRKEVEDENLFRKMKSLLNKLTLDKFEKLCGQIMALEINTPRRMEGCIVLVFDKALDEPGFASMYADLCKRLSTLEVKVPETPGQSDAEKKKKEYNFRRLLLNKCQVEFEKERDIPPRQEGVAAEDEDIKVVRARLRMFGNIKFIGELFKRHMLTEKIMHECVKQLLSADKRAGNDKKLPSEEAIECLTKLLSTVGKMLDRPEAKSHMDAYFQRLGELAKQKAFPSRIRFLIQEVIDLRHQNWIPRRADNTPKTIEEVHRQAALDAQKAAAQSQQAQAAYQHGGGYGRTNSQGGRGGGQFGGFRGGPPQQQQNPDGWNTVGNRQNTRADLQALRNARSVSSDGRQAEGASPSLGPGGRLGGPGMWAAHAQQAAAKPNALGQRGTVGGAGPSMGGGGFTKNSFAMLHQEEDDDHGDMGQRSRSRDNREGEQTSSPALGAGWRPTLSGFKPTAPSKATPPVTPTIPKKSESGAGPRAMQGAEKDKAAGPQLSKEEFVRKLKGMVEQYASIKDITEARQDLKDMGTVSLHSLLVEKMVGDYLENKKVRPGAADLLAIFVRDGSISKQDFYAGLDAHVEFLEDLEVDVPKIYDYLAEYVGPLVADGTITLLDLTENLKHLETLRSMPCEGAAKLLAAILRYVAEKQGADKAKELWVASGLNLAKFLEDGRQEEADVSDFAKSKKIEFILA